MGIVNDLSSFSATLIRLGRGLNSAVTADKRREPKEPLQLYDFEGCPYCRKVREVLCELDLDYLSLPTARGSTRRLELRALGGKVQVPYLVDPNTGAQLYESDEIIAYLNRTYGATSRAGWTLPVPSVVDNVVSAAASAARFGAGTRCTTPTTVRRNLQPLELYNMEGSPYCRKVRETLSELDLICLVRNVPKGSPKRRTLQRRGGKVQVPYLIDPNTGEELYESDDIVAYLTEQYGPPPVAGTPRRGRAAAPTKKPRRGSSRRRAR